MASLIARASELASVLDEPADRLASIWVDVRCSLNVAFRLLVANLFGIDDALDLVGEYAED